MARRNGLQVAFSLIFILSLQEVLPYILSFLLWKTPDLYSGMLCVCTQFLAFFSSLVVST